MDGVVYVSRDAHEVFVSAETDTGTSVSRCVAYDADHPKWLAFERDLRNTLARLGIVREVDEVIAAARTVADGGPTRRVLVGSVANATKPTAWRDLSPKETIVAVALGEIDPAMLGFVNVDFGVGLVSLLYVMQAPREMLTPAQQVLRGTLMRCGLRPHGDSHGEVSAWRDGPPSVADIAAHEASASVGRDLGAPWLRVLHGRDIAVRYLSAQGGVARFRDPAYREWIDLASLQEGAFGPWCPLVVPT